jgi:hypothetical protein
LINLEIPKISTNGIVVRKIGELDIPDISASVIPEPRFSIPNTPPVTVNIGVPVVDIPGCVEAHETNNPKNDKVTEDDENGLVTFCDSSIPSFNPIDYKPDEMIFTPKEEIPAYKAPEAPEQPVDVSDSKVPVTPPSTAKVECPTAEQLQKEPVGFIFDSGRKKITGYRLEGNQCVREIEDVPIVSQVINAIPPASTITTTASIAVVATTSALLAKPFADILLKVVKPVVKKVVKKIASIRGKEVVVLSAAERRAEQRDRNQAIKELRSALKPKG